MSGAYVIEIGEDTAGIVVKEGRSFRFYASSHRFNAIDGQNFETPAAAEKAARRIAPRRAWSSVFQTGEPAALLDASCER